MEQEYGKCSVCGKEGTISRTYFHYDLRCECHSPNHFEIVYHCVSCKAKAPSKTTVYLKPVNAIGN